MPIRERKIMTVEMDHPLVQEIEGDDELVEFGRACKQSAAIFKDKGFEEVADDLMALAESCGVKRPGRKPGSKNAKSGGSDSPEGETDATGSSSGSETKAAVEAAPVTPPATVAGSNGAATKTFSGPKIKIPDPEDVKFSEVDG